jgi:hypothetical protein
MRTVIDTLNKFSDATLLYDFSSEINLLIARGNPAVTNTKAVIYKGYTILKIPIPSVPIKRIIMIW